MKKSILFFVIIFLFSCTSIDYEVKEDDGKKIVVGRISWDKWQEVAGWESYEPKHYYPDIKYLDRFKELAGRRDIKFILFGASWCGDSKSEMPKIYELFEIAGLFMNKVILYGVDRNKEALSDIAQDYKIERVPTLLILEDYIEIGRIVEYPQVSWQVDIIDIIEESNI